MQKIYSFSFNLQKNTTSSQSSSSSSKSRTVGSGGNSGRGGRNAPKKNTAMGGMDKAEFSVLAAAH